MAKSTDPFIDQWYHYPQKSQKFMVTAIDDTADTVEIQYFDGTPARGACIITREFPESS